MKRKLLQTLLAIALCFPALHAQESFEKYFHRKTLRIDFALSGNNNRQAAAIEQLREEPTWAGPLNNRIDPFEYGGYYVRVYNAADRTLIYSKGFNTLFEEWRSTEQAKVQVQSWTNSVCVPFPREKVIVELAARDKSDMLFHTLLEMEVDPSSIFIDRSPLKKNRVERILDNGDVNKKTDIVFLAEGYTAEEQDKFFADAKRFADALFTFAPFDQRKEEINIWAVGTVSEESGTDVSGKGVYKNTALNSGFYTFGVDRYLTTPDMKAIRNAVWETPTDAVFILVNTNAYGGGGMYNFYAMGTADNERTLEVFVHEFGHSLAGLADEYYSSEVAYGDFYNLNFEPWEPNISTLKEAFETKWKDMLPKGTPVPTPLNGEHKDRVGVYEGGGYVSKGIYRPSDHCMMKDLKPFCPVCQRAVLRMLDYYEDK